MSVTYTVTSRLAATPSELDSVSVLADQNQVNALYTIDDLLFDRSQTIPNTPLVAYPATSKGQSDYVHYTAHDLNRFADHGAHKYASLGVKPKTQGPEAEVIALLAPSNLDYVACIFALSRLGFTVLLLSNRLATEAYVSLLEKTKCRRLVSSESLIKQVAAIQSVADIDSFPLLRQSEYDFEDNTYRYAREQSTPAASRRIAFIIHSSGSTGLPKPIFQTQAACLMNYSSSFGYRAFLTLPLYHNHGLSSFFRAVHSGKEIAMFNANLPLSEPNLIAAMEAVEPESFHGVPYALKLLAETGSGVEALKKCKLVLFGGSSCPDDLGDRLVAAGVYLVGHYGATEIGQLMTSFRPSGDKAWNYVRPLEASIPYILMDRQAPDTYECVVLDGLPSKVVSNSNDPPNSFRTSDIFSPHPTISSAWKYLGRSDDRVTLINGEKVLPIPYEHQIREHELVREACVFGVDRAFPGLIIIPSEKAASLNKTQLLDCLWPTVQAANSRAESFGHISREMIEILDVGADYPSTDKGTMIRKAFYRQFEKLINSIYLGFDAPIGEDDSTRLQLNVAELKVYLHRLFVDSLEVGQLQDETDFFEAGVDSLKALSARGTIIRKLDLGSGTLGQNAIFEHPNIPALAEHLHALRAGVEAVQIDEIKTMESLIRKYSTFKSYIPGTDVSTGETVILTGTTGSLGAHVLAQLVAQHNVRKVYCLVRASNDTEARARVLSTLSSKKLDSNLNAGKIECLHADLSREDLGLAGFVLETIFKTLTKVIHCAWAVNFNLGVSSFEQHHIKGTYNLLNLCLRVSTPQPAQLYFCSSISAAAGTPLPANIEEIYINQLSHAQGMGYARSKLVTETIIKHAGEQTGMVARVLRVGQIVGDTQIGLWNSTEAISLMIRSAVTIGALPALEETPSWLPVDIVARSVLELSNTVVSDANAETDTQERNVVYHVQNPHLFHWTNDLLPALRDAGLSFETVSQREWVQRLRESEPDPEKNPTIKLLDFFTEKYDNDRPGRMGLVFLTEKTGEKSEAIRNGYDIVESGIVKKIIESWKCEW